MISIVTPCLNIVSDGRSERFSKMMKSIQQQSYADREHIVIDGGSTDGTLELLTSYKAKGYITKLVSEKDSGVYEAMNKGIRLAHGEYINIMNTDDYITDPTFYAESIRVLEKGDFDFTHADKVVEFRTGANSYVKRGNIAQAFYRMPFRHQTMVVTKKTYEQVGLYDESYQIAADYKFVLSLILSGKRGYYFPRVFISALDGGLSSDREKCITEVSRVLYESYGKDSELTLDECKDIYLKQYSFWQLAKNWSNIKSTQVLRSLLYGLYAK